MVHQKWFRQVLRRRFFVILLLVLQGAVLIGLILDTGRVSELLNLALSAVSILVALQIVSSRDKPSYKLLWIFLLLLVPVFGGLFYLLVSFQSSTRKTARRLSELERTSRPLLEDGGARFDAARAAAPDCIPQMRYLEQAGFPVYPDTECTYFPSGEAVFARLCEELRKAKRYIFLEFFIIQEGVMWDTIHEILLEKVSQGVVVRVLYDDIGSFITLPKDFAARLRAEGMECCVFNPFRPVLSSIQNNRDHRKIVSIDGVTAFTGGFNLADEYINAVEKHGHWKDAGLLVRGDAAWSLTVMFLQMWDLACGSHEVFSRFQPAAQPPAGTGGEGLAQPYADSPIDKENVGEHVYLHIIGRAKRYVYIYTPYLIIDDSVLSVLALAAKSGVDVRILTPHHWDKWIIHMTTRAYYRPLIEAGVRIYEYTPGFLHAKAFVSDDAVATVGSVNLDYRSLYLHFECGVWMYKTRAVAQLKEDFLHTLEVSEEIRAADFRCGVLFRLFQEVLRLLAPLM